MGTSVEDMIRKAALGISQPDDFAMRSLLFSSLQIIDSLRSATQHPSDEAGVIDHYSIGYREGLKDWAEKVDENKRQQATIADLVVALEDAIGTLACVERPARIDPDHGEAVAALGNRIGFGALMSSASASWREFLSASGTAGGEFVAGPCMATVTGTLRRARAALSKALPSTQGETK